MGVRKVSNSYSDLQGHLSTLAIVPMIFNASLREGYLPPIWKSAEVVPVPKLHPPISIHNDLKPISLLPTIAKVFEKVVSFLH